MHQSCFFVSRLAESLDIVLRNAWVEACFSQQKDELILAFSLQNGQDFFIKAEVQQGIGLLSFPENFHRMRGNSVDLFPQISGLQMQKVKAVLFDRSFHFVLEKDLQLCFKMYGAKANVLLHDGKKTLEIFNHHIKKDLEIHPPDDLIGLLPGFGKYHPNPDELKKSHPMLGKELWQTWEKLAEKTPGTDRQLVFGQFLENLKNGKLYICQKDQVAFVSAYPDGEILLESQNPIEIANRFQKAFWGINRFEKEKDIRLKHWEKKLFQIQNAIRSGEKQIQANKESEGFQLQGDLLMAYGFQIPKGTELVRLPHFSEERWVEIKLKKELTVSENAERFYRKAKGEKENELRLEQNLEIQKVRFFQTQKEYQSLQNAKQWMDLKPFVVLQKKGEEDEESLPYWPKTFLDFEIWIGKNAKANDEMLRLAHKDDLWLHARDSPGSHVIVRKKKEKTVPKPVLERAAQWAAFFSKSKNESLVPVMVTERKYVRKIKGNAPGLVKVEREKTVMVEPKP
jgi:predicted ribosome quality control (RQC) complex YloA/Tae2 family protein